MRVGFSFVGTVPRRLSLDVFVKYLPDGTVEHYKTRLVAKGYTQTYGIVYVKTSPAAKIGSVRILISLAANLRGPLFQFDVKNVFLHGDLNDEVYMGQPPEFVAQGRRVMFPAFVRLFMALSSLQELGSIKFSNVVQRLGMHRYQTDHSVFSSMIERGRTLVIVYVDGTIIIRDDTEGIEELKTFL